MLDITGINTLAFPTRLAARAGPRLPLLRVLSPLENRTLGHHSARRRLKVEVGHRLTRRRNIKRLIRAWGRVSPSVGGILDDDIGIEPRALETGSKSGSEVDVIAKGTW